MAIFPDPRYGSLTPLSARQLQEYEVRALAALYWPIEEVEHAVRVAQLESGFWTNSHNTTGEDSRGLWQINCVAAAHPELAKWNLFDPQVNAFFAHRIWRAGGWRPWYNSARALNLPLG
jgi:hypothetical protein